MKILLTGGCGFVGSHIAERLLAAGDEVLIYDNFSTGKLANVVDLLTEYKGKIEIWDGGSCAHPKDNRRDITDLDELSEVFATFRPQWVCHQAAQPSLLESNLRPEQDAAINIVGTLNIVTLSKKYNCQIVFASTSAVFGKEHKILTEDTKPDPYRPYGIAKRAAEIYLQHSEVTNAILRYGNVYGPRQLPIGENQLIARLFSHIYKGTPFSIFGDGKNRRDFIYAQDVARANIAVIHRNLSGIFHIGTGISWSVNQVVSKICELTAFKKEIVFTETIDEPREIIMQSVRWPKIGWWQPRVDLDEGLARTALWWEERKDITV